MRTSPVVVDRFCTRCGAGADADARFCARCGLDLVTPGAPEVPPPSAAIPQVPPGPALGVPTGQPADSGPPVAPFAIGRRASPLGWLGVVAVAGALLAASIGVTVLAGVRGTGPAPSPAEPLARFDQVLYDGSTVSDGVPFTIDVEAVNPAEQPTGRLWMVVEWRPADLGVTPGVRGELVRCDPGDCASREDPAAGITVVSWPGLAAGERDVLRLTVRAEGLERGTTFWYRVRTGSGATETDMAGGFVWDLDLEVE